MQAIFEFVKALILELWPLTVVDPWEAGVRVRLGRWVRDLRPGLHISLPFMDAVHVVNVKRQAVNMPPQNIQTLDLQTFVIKGSVEYEVVDARKIWLEVQDHDESLIEVVQGLLAEYISTKISEELEVNKIEKDILRTVRREGKRWGLLVNKLYISDLAPSRPYRIMLDGDVGLSMSS